MDKTSEYCGRKPCRDIRLFGAAVLLIFAVSVSINIWLCSQLIPHVNGDAMFFAPQTVHEAQGLGLKNLYYDVALNYSSLRDGRQIWHGYLYEMLASGLMPSADYRGWLAANRIIDGVTLGAISLFFFFARKSAAYGFQLLFLAAALLAMNGYMLGLQGRPESLSLCLFSLMLLFSHLPESNVKWLLNGCFTGLCFVTSPIQGMIAGLLSTVYCLTQAKSVATFAKRWLIICVAAGSAAVCSLFLFPYTLTELIGGISQHTKVVRPTGLRDFFQPGTLRSLTIYTGHFFLGPVLAAGWILAVVSTGRWSAIPYQKAVRAGVILLGMIILYYFLASGWYIACAVLPAILGLGLYYHQSGHTPSSAKWPVFLLTGFLCISAADPLLYLVATKVGYHGVRLEEAKALLAQDLNGDVDDTAFSTKGFLLSDQQKRNDTLIYEQFKDPVVLSDKKFLVLVQDYGDDGQTRVFKNYRLIKNRLIANQPTKGPERLRQWFYPAGFQYALYERSP